MWEMSIVYKQYGFRTQLIWSSHYCLFLFWPYLDQSKTSTKQKTTNFLIPLYTICANNDSLCQDILADIKSG